MISVHLVILQVQKIILDKKSCTTLWKLFIKQWTAAFGFSWPIKILDN